MSSFTSSAVKGWLRFRTPAAILVVYAAVQATVWTWPTLQSYVRFQAFVGSSSVTALMMAGWFLFNRQLSGVTKYLGTGICCVAALGVMKSTRVDGYLGDTTPNITWRWSEKLPAIAPGVTRLN